MRTFFTIIAITLFPFFSRGVNPESTYVFSHGTLKDGIYLTFEELKNNTPTIDFSEAVLKQADTTSYHLNIASLVIGGKTLKQYKKIWGVVIDGIPYINYKGKNQDKSFAVNAHSKLGKPDQRNPVTFYRMDVYGNVCLFALEHVQRTGMPKSYSGFTIPKGIQFVRVKALDIRTGTVHDLTPGFVWDLVKDDAFVLEVLNSDYNSVNLVQIIELYNGRNPLFPVANSNSK